MTEARRRAERRGRRAEKIAACLLRLKAYRILARRYKTRVGEIDLVARRGGVLVFVEVKSRATRDRAMEALGARQRLRIQRAAGHFLAREPSCANLDIRFDVIWVVPGRWPRHSGDAWRP